MSEIFTKVLYIGPLNTFGGIGAVLRTYEKNIDRFNFISTHNDYSKIGNALFFIYSIVRISFYLMMHPRIEIVHIHSASKGSFIRKLIIVYFARMFRKKIVFHMHGGQFKEYYKGLQWGKRLFSQILQEVDIFICLTDEWKLYFQDHLGLNNVIVLGNPVKIESAITTKPFNNVVSLLFLGSLNSKKGIFELVDYLYTNSYFQNKQIKLTIGGTGEVDKLIQKIQMPEANSQINYIGFVSGRLKDDAIRNCDVFILPSYYEGLPVSILEAMGHGKPVIGTRVGGVPSVVEHNKNGWLFDAGSFKQLDNIFEEIVMQRFSIPQYQLNAYNKAKMFTSDKILFDLSIMYKNLLNEKV